MCLAQGHINSALEVKWHLSGSQSTPPQVVTVVFKQSNRFDSVVVKGEMCLFAAVKTTVSCTRDP